jgi:hypothetical protein
MVILYIPLVGNEYDTQESICQYFTTRLGMSYCMYSHQQWTRKELDTGDIVRILSSCNDGAVSARKTLSFLRTNSTL